MRIVKGFKLREIAGETILVNQGLPDADLTRVISLNESARLLWERLSGREFSLADGADVLTERYGIDREQALHDVRVWADSLRSCGVLA